MGDDNLRKLASLALDTNDNDINKSAVNSSNRFMNRTHSTASNLLKAVSVKFGGGRSTSMSAKSKSQFMDAKKKASAQDENIAEDKENVTADTFFDAVTEFIGETDSSMRSRLDVERKRAQAARFPVNLWSIASEKDAEIEDSLTKEQHRLKEIKNKISLQSKRNFLLERDVRYLDSRIALLIQNRMALDEDLLFQNSSEDSGADQQDTIACPDDRKKQLYGNLFFLLQTEPRIVSNLVQLITLSEIDTILQTVMFTLYGNQYDSREEHLLLTMFQTVLKAQFDATTDFGSLLRANTPVSRMMTTYTRRGPGQQYLKHVLTENINKILAHDEHNLEINPVKVYEQMINDMEVDTGNTCELPRNVTAEEAMSHEEVKKKIVPRVAELMRLAATFLDTIVTNIDQVPYGIRWICKQIRLLTKKKFPEVKDMAICSLIGGFFLLRFLNPAIVTPQSYMIIDSQPSKNPRRTLTLIAKMLQNVANKPSYAKEEFMMALNPFVESNKERVCKFLMDLCDVPDFYESIELEQYMALSKKDININITLNELYSTHMLLTQHLALVCSQQNMDKSMNAPEKKSYAVSCDHLKTILSDLGSAHQQVSRAENRTLNLNLFSRWESTPVLFPNAGGSAYAKESPELAEADFMYTNTKLMIVHVLRKQAGLVSSAYVNHAYTPSITIDSLPEFYPGLINVEEILDKAASQCKDSLIVKDSLKVRQNLRILEERFRHPNVKHAEGYESLASEVYNEFVRLNDLKGKIGKEIMSLENVYNTICEHNQYLRSQLSSYRAYLQNVRIQASGGNPNPSLPENPKTKKKGTNGHGPVRFSHSQLEKDGVIVMSSVPENRRSNVFFCIEMPTPGSFTIGLHYKGRDKAIVEVEIKLDDLLEKQQDNVQLFDLEYVQLNVNKTLHILNKYFMKLK